MKLKGAIFDMDGTLIDSMPFWEHIGEHYLKSIGITPKEDLCEMIRPMHTNECIHYLKEAYSLPYTEEEIGIQIEEILKDAYQNVFVPKPGALEFLKMLHALGIKICIATATPRHLAEIVLRRFDILSLSEGLLSCREIGVNKEKPDIYREALKLLGTSREDTLVFEDALYAVKTAKKDGFFVVAIKDDATKHVEAEVKKFSDFYLTSYTVKNQIETLLRLNF